MAERGFSALDFRFLIMRGHYRSQLNFTWEALEGAAEARKNLLDWRGRLQAAAREEAAANGDASHAAIPAELVAAAVAQFEAALADDLNTSEALAAVFGLRNQFMQQAFTGADAQQACDFLGRVDDIFGLFEAEDESDGLSDADVEALIEQRTAARESKDWAKADQIRDQLQEAGIVIEDKAGSVHWHRA